MSKKILHFLIVVLLASVKSKSFVSTAPAEKGVQPDQEVADEVQQLDDLRKEHGKGRDHVTEVKNPEPEPGTKPDQAPQHLENDAQPQPEPTRLANSRSAIFRHRGITEAKKNHLYDLQKEDQSDEYAKFSGIQYSPAELAEYIFRTGDEQGVALAVDELVREGMMGRTDAINYLQDVKETVLYMKDQFEKARALEEINSRGYPRPQVSQRLPPIPREQFVSQLDASKREPKQYPNPRPMTTAEPPHQVATASSPMPKMSTYHDSTTPRPLPVDGDQSQVPQKKEAAGMDQNANALYDEYTLEEVIYQLSKDMFTQSMSRGDQTAEDTLSRLITFLESEVDNKRISREMKEKVLEIVSASLVDSLREYPGLLNDEPQLQSDPSSQGSLYRPDENSLIADKRSAPEDVQKKLSLSGSSKLFQLNAGSDKQKSRDDKAQLSSNSQNLQKASLASSRTKRT